MERYDESLYGGNEGGWKSLVCKHPILMTTLAVIAVVLLVLLVFSWAIQTMAKFFGWGVYGKSDSFVGSYLPWRPNVVDKSEIDAVINANASSPPIPIPVGLMVAGNDATYLESNLGSA
jgi:hypothetical protein